MDVLAAFLQTALDCIPRGWYVFPCRPADKRPLTPHGYLDASNNEAQIRAWWTKWPEANVAIATGASGLTVLDCDHGFRDEEALRDFMAAYNIPATFAVRTGKRTEYRVQLYYTGPQMPSREWELDGHSGDIRSETGYVMAEGCVHPESKARYGVLWDLPIVPVPDVVRTLKSKTKERVQDDGGPITDNRNVTLTSIAGKLRNAGLSHAALEVSLLQVNADRCIPPLQEEEVKQIAKHAASWELPEPEPVVIIGGKALAGSESPREWRSLFHTKDEMENAPPISFLIKGFLQREGVTAIAAPVRERKSLIALNVVYALLTGEKLFDYFEVVKQPERVLYLCPEVSLGPFTARIKRIGLMDYIGTRLFCRTLSADGKLTLKDPALLPALPGSVVVLDTAIRFFDGDESSSLSIPRRG